MPLSGIMCRCWAEGASGIPEERERVCGRQVGARTVQGNSGMTKRCQIPDQPVFHLNVNSHQVWAARVSKTLELVNNSDVLRWCEWDAELQMLRVTLHFRLWNLMQVHTKSVCKTETSHWRCCRWPLLQITTLHLFSTHCQFELCKQVNTSCVLLLESGWVYAWQWIHVCQPMLLSAFKGNESITLRVCPSQCVLTQERGLWISHKLFSGVVKETQR